MKGLLKLSSLEDKLPLVYNWLKHAEATRRLVIDNYAHLEGEELIEMTVAENVLTQLENLQTYPIIHSRLHKGNLALHGWVYRIETGEVLSYDGILHDFVTPQNRLPDPEPVYHLHPNSKLMTYTPFKVGSERGKKAAEAAVPEIQPQSSHQTSSLPGFSHLPAEQANRIYRGSH